MTPAPSLPSLDDIEAVRRKLVELAAEGRTAELIELVIQLLTDLRNTNTAQAARLNRALRELYGRKSQKVSAEQLSLMLSTLREQDPANRPPESPSAALDESAPPPAGEGSGSKPPERPKRRRDGGGRSPLPKDLPRETRVVSVPAIERTCEECGAEKASIGYRTSKILEFVPAHFRVIIEERREKLACLACPEDGFRGFMQGDGYAGYEAMMNDEDKPVVPQDRRLGCGMHIRAKCFTDGRFEIDNGEAERNQRRIALGRRNYLFAGSDQGAVRLAVGYTVLGSCRLCGVNPLEWAAGVLAKLQAGWPKSRRDELLPHVWAKDRPAAA